MGLFNKMKNFFSSFKYKLDREILREYLQYTINFAVENKLPFCDEFYIADSLDVKDRLHVAILNYDVPGEAVYEIVCRTIIAERRGVRYVYSSNLQNKRFLYGQNA